MSLKVTFSGVDRESKSTSTTLELADATLDADIIAIASDIDAITLASGYKAVKTVSTELVAGDNTPPASGYANRGMKYLLRFQTTNGNGDSVVVTNEIGIADYTVLPVGSDYLDLTAGAGLALKTDLDAAYVGPYGTGGTLLSVQQVTRSD